MVHQVDNGVNFHFTRGGSHLPARMLIVCLVDELDGPTWPLLCHSFRFRFRDPPPGGARRRHAGRDAGTRPRGTATTPAY